MRSYQFTTVITVIVFVFLMGISMQASASQSRVLTLQQEVMRQINRSNEDCTQALQRLLDYCEERYTAQSPQYAESVLWAAMVAHRSRDYRQSRELIGRSDALFKKYGVGPFFGRDTINEIFRLDLLTIIEEDNQRDYYALKYARKATKLKKAFFGNDSEVTMNAMLDVSKLYASRLRNRDSSRAHTEAYNTYVSTIRNKFCAMSDLGRENYWNTAIKYIQKTTSLAYKKGKKNSTRNKSFSMETYNALLLSKGLLLNVSTGFERFVKKNGNNRAKELLKRKQELLADGESPLTIDSIDYAIIAALNEDGIRYTIPELSISWRDVQDNMGEDDLAIEFYHTSTKEYGAVLLRKDWKQPKLISLKDHISHKDYISNKRRVYMLDDGLMMCKDSLQIDSIRFSKEFNEFYWKVGKTIWDDRIISHFPRTDKGKVYFSADGLLQVVGIEYFPFVKPTEEREYTMAELYNMNRLSSTRILAINGEKNSDFTATLFGGLAYQMTEVSMQDEGKKHLKKRGLDYSQRYSREGAISAIKSLPNTLKEVDEISSIIKNNNGTPKKYVEENGVEEAFKSLSGRSPQVLHVATHGFYLPQIAPNESRSEVDNPLKRTGLLLAGAYQAYIKHNKIAGVEDGVLSAYEISQLNLNRVELAVLSACETGLGDITNDGVAGLQRGFKMAGAKCLLMSLWKVDDEATCYLMTEFYRNWVERNMDKTQALQEAQLSLKTDPKHPEWRDPKYWAAFILLDDYQK